MCGIWLLCGLESHQSLHCNDAFVKIQHRGPDAWRLEMDRKIQNVILGFQRLSIVDSLYGMQPMRLHKYPHLALICNGEIYNCKKLQTEFQFPYETKCDVEVILHLYATGGIEHCVKHLDGVFGFCIIDAAAQQVHISRDPYGVRPLFVLKSESGVLGICSEAKGLVPLKSLMNGSSWTLSQFTPGHYESYNVDQIGRVKFSERKQYYDIGVSRPLFNTSIPWSVLESGRVKDNIVKLLTNAVVKRLMAERRIGCLLSGGLDSSLIAALLVRAAKTANLPYKIQTFSVGMGTSPDIVAARIVAQHIGSEHHEVIFTEEDVSKVLDKVLFTLETADITTVRASVGMYILAEYIKNNTESTVIFSGEGADEVAQGYIYFRDAPTPSAGHDESCRLLKDVYLYDGLRADRTTAAHSLELRLPFLDQQFTSYYLSLPAEDRQPVKGVEKHLLRSAFDDTDLIPKSILWRHKEAFSDGVASTKKSLFQVLQEIIDKRVSKQELENSSERFPHCTPKTLESYYYRLKFEENFPKSAEKLMPYFWMPKWIQVDDPSARFISHYAANKES